MALFRVLSALFGYICALEVDYTRYPIFICEYNGYHSKHDHLVPLKSMRSGVLPQHFPSLITHNHTRLQTTKSTPISLSHYNASQSTTAISTPMHNSLSPSCSISPPHPPLSTQHSNAPSALLVSTPHVAVRVQMEAGTSGDAERTLVRLGGVDSVGLRRLCRWGGGLVCGSCG